MGLVAGTVSPDDVDFCFPASPYPPDFIGHITWDYTVYIANSCQPRIGVSSTEYRCICTQYQMLGLFNYYQMVTTFLPLAIYDRMYDSRIVFQFLITRIPIIQPLLNGFWQTFFGLIPLVSWPRGFLLFFDADYALYGLSLEANIGCLLVNLFSPLYVLSFLLGPAILIYVYFAEIIIKFGNWVFNFFCVRPYRRCMLYTSFNYYETKLEELEEEEELTEEEIKQYEKLIEEEKRQKKRYERNLTKLASNTAKLADIVLHTS